MTANSLKIFETLASDPNFLFFAEYLEKQLDAEVKQKILSGKELGVSDYERVKIFSNIKHLPKQYAAALKREQKVLEREKKTELY